MFRAEVLTDYFATLHAGDFDVHRPYLIPGWLLQLPGEELSFCFMFTTVNLVLNAVRAQHHTNREAVTLSMDHTFKVFFSRKEVPDSVCHHFYSIRQRKS